jgi:site-specific recombinase XerD
MNFSLIREEDEHLPICLSEYLTFLGSVSAKSKGTISGYKADLIVFFRFLNLYKGIVSEETEFKDISITNIDNSLLSTVTLKDLYKFIFFIERYRENSNYAKARKTASLKSFFKFMYKTKAIPENPALDLDGPKLSKRHPVYMNLEECEQLLKSINGKYKSRDICIITLFLNCGLRLSELCGINVSDIRKDTLTVIGKGNKERTIYLNEACIEALKNYLKERKELKRIIDKDALFISRNFKRIDKRSVEKLLKKHLKEANLDEKGYSPHKLRHSAATLMYQYGNVDIRSLQSILGHTNISTTQIYTHLDDNKLRSAVHSNPLNIRH